MGNLFCPPGSSTPSSSSSVSSTSIDVNHNNAKCVAQHQQQQQFQVHQSFNSIISHYDGFILDQWGVMHNGKESMIGAKECIAELARRGKKLVILSNTPSSESDTLDKLPSLGFSRHAFTDGAVTSGDLAGEYIQATYGSSSSSTDINTTKKKKKSRALLFAWQLHPDLPNADEFLKRCGDIQLVNSVDENPDFLIIHGLQVILGPKDVTDTDDGETTTVKTRQETSLGNFVLHGNIEEVIRPILVKCRELSIPLLCVDPDLITVEPDGTVYQMPGTVAQYYETQLGGEVINFGKPDSRGFERAMTRLQTNHGIPKRRICHIGDSLHHDVAGANSVDVDCTLVLGGVHRIELGNELGGLASPEKLELLFQKVGQTPTHVAPLFKI